MEQLRLKSTQLVNAVSTSFSRYLSEEIDWNQRLIGIIGARGTGKTTLLLQQIKKRFQVDPQALYVSLDDIFFAGRSLLEFASEFHSKGGNHLFIDEIHKHPLWSQQIKAIYENLPNINVVFAGSSTIEMIKHYANLSQRATIYNLLGLSFREYLAMHSISGLPNTDLETILNDHVDIAKSLPEDARPLMYFDRYLTRGYYPFEVDGYEQYKRCLEEVLQLTVESDMAYMEGYDPRNAHKIKRLISIIAQNVPFKPNLVKISEAIDVHRNTLIGYFFHLEKANLIKLLYPSGSMVSILQKPEKVYFNNSALAQLLSYQQPSRETLLKTFVISQLSANYPIKIAKYDTLDIDGKWFFTIETGKRISRKRNLKESIYHIADGIEIGLERRVPAWMLGLMY